MGNVTVIKPNAQHIIGQFPPNFAYYAFLHNYGPGAITFSGGIQDFVVPAGQSAVYVAEKGNLAVSADKEGSAVEVRDAGVLQLNHP